MSERRTTLADDLMSEALLPENRRPFDHQEVRLSGVGLCRRKRVLTAIGEPGYDQLIPWTYDEGGHCLQDRFYYKRVKPRFPEAVLEQSIYHPFGIGDSFGVGHIDIYIPSLRKIIEVKSISCYAFKHELPKDFNVRQVKAQWVSSNVFYPQFNVPISSALLFYVCREHFAEHFMGIKVDAPTNEEAEDIFQELRTVKLERDQRTPPEVPFPAPIWECKACPYAKGCWPEKQSVNMEEQ